MENKDVPFSFGWLAMKLLGKSLYSNTWSAISELVANGFDAGAQTVYIFIDIKNKKESIIEIFDDGKGMTREEIDTYVQVGYNKRIDPKFKEKLGNLKPMGRKGIGKLAALYLSQDYYLITKTKTSITKWQMLYIENLEKEDEKPSLKQVEKDIPIFCKEIWNKIKTGTLLRLTNVNLEGKEKSALTSLEHKLSNYFALSTLNKKIMLCIYNGKEIEFKEVKKSIAFGNMAFIEHAQETMSLKDEIDRLEKHIIKMPFSGKAKKKKENYEHKIDISSFKEKSFPLIGTYPLPLKNHKKVKQIPYKLTGWIGIHGTINTTAAERNDLNFTKSQDYNPNQLRLYIRNKLAIENCLNIIGNTQAFVNYIEGEISFDLLDDDDLPDIATSNRQSMIENDDRIELLKNLIKPIIDDLIDKRGELANKIKEEQKKLEGEMDTSAKKQFSQDVDREISRYGDNIPKEIRNELTTTLINQVKGDVNLKEDRQIFISHNSANEDITDFLFHLLIKRGCQKKEFFYTSKKGERHDPQNTKALKDIIKDSIVNTNNLLFYLTSDDYKKSEYCMFEGGAGWATRSVGEYLLWALKYNDIPKFLTNDRYEIIVKEHLDESNYNNIVVTLNTMIQHINSARIIKGKETINLFPEVIFPDIVELSKNGKTIEDYMDEDIKEYWKKFVVDKKAFSKPLKNKYLKCPVKYVDVPPCETE